MTKPVAPTPPNIAPKPPVVDSKPKTPARTDYSARSKYRFSMVELCEMFNLTRPTLKKMLGDTAQAPSDGRRGVVYDIIEIATLEDVRITEKHINKDKDLLELDDNGDPVSIGTPSQMKAHYAAKDMEQAYIAKKMRNDVTSRNLLPADEVERLIAQAFKGLATFVDNIPDILERGGMIKNSDIPRIIEMTDKIRNQLAEDMSKIGDPEHSEFDTDFIEEGFDDEEVDEDE